MKKGIFFKKIYKFIQKKKISGFIIGIISFFLVFVFSFSNTYNQFELKLYDLRFKFKPKIKEWNRLSFVDIDERSLQIVGNFPWRRSTYVNGIRALQRVGVNQFSLDIMFLDNSPNQLDLNSMTNLQKKVQKGERLSKNDLNSLVYSEDNLFASSVFDMGKVILPFVFSTGEIDKEVLRKRDNLEYKSAYNEFLEKSSIAVNVKDKEKYKLLDDQKLTIFPPILKLMKSAKMFGFVDRDTDIDGITRKIRMVRYNKGKLFFNLSFVMFMDACNISFKDVEVKSGDAIYVKNFLDPLTQIHKNIKIPIDNQGMMYINWAGSGPREKSFNIIPFSALLEYIEWTAEESENFFDQIESENQSFVLSSLYEKSSNLKKKYEKADDKNRKIIWNQLILVKEEILNKKRDYINILKTNILEVEDTLKSGVDPKLKEEYELLKGDLSVYNGVLKVENLSNHIVISGLTAAGTHDLGATPNSNDYARVGIYPNAINTIIQNEFIRKSPILIDYLLMLIIIFIMVFLVQSLNARQSVLAIVGLSLFINFIIIIIFGYLNIWIQQLGIIMSLIIPSVTIVSLKYMREESQRRFIKNAFSHYLAPGVIDEIIKNPDSLELGGENRVITTFFSDIQGFSSISENLTAPELVSLLNEYLSAMTDIILSYGGTIDKYEGDAIMAFYGAPVLFEDHALRACYAMIDMKKKLRDLQDKWKELGRIELYARMGMNTGDAVVGNMGSTTRMDYTAMGDSVNLASRLEGANKFYSTYSMISDATYELVKDYVEVRKLDKIKVVGKNEPVIIYELLSRKGNLSNSMYNMLENYKNGLDLFQTREWEKAKEEFKKALLIIDDDGPSQVYVKRCEFFMKKPPSKNWDGVYKLTSK